MTTEERAYYTKISALSTIFFVLAIALAIKLKKGFWAGFAYSILGSMIGSGIGYLVFKYPKQ
jgi:hypothetical protein